MTKYRKHLTGCEAEKLMAATKGSRHKARDLCLFLPLLTFGKRLMNAPFNICYIAAIASTGKIF